MRIGIDVQMLCRPITGLGRYAFEVIQRMRQLRPEARFFLYAPGPLVAGIEAGDDVSIRHKNWQFRGAGILAAQAAMPYWAKKDRLDVFWGPAHRLPLFLAKDIASVVTVHDLVWKYAPETLRPLNILAEKLLMPLAIKQADEVIAVSRSTAEAIRAEFPKARDKTSVAHLGVTTFPAPEDAEALRRFGIDRPYFLFVGTLEPRKNLRRLLVAFSSLDITARDRCVLVIAGGKGWGNEDLAGLIDTLGIGGAVRMTGYISEGELATLYRHARFLAMPSLYEGFGLPVVEALSFGVPVLTSNTSSLPEVAGDAGLLIDPLLSSDIAAGLERMIMDDGFRDALAKQAAEQASKFNWNETASRTLAAFDRAIELRKKV